MEYKENKKHMKAKVTCFVHNSSYFQDHPASWVDFLCSSFFLHASVIINFYYTYYNGLYH